MKLPGSITLNVIDTSGVVPAQLGRQESMVRKDVFTGMVWCPVKLSGIAILRCAEYQKALGCGRGCRNAAAPGLISLVTENLKLSEEAYKECRRCRRTFLVLNKEGLCRSCGPGRGFYTVCHICGKPKGRSVARRCRACAMERRKKVYGK